VVLDMLRNHSRIKVIQEKPIVLQYMVKEKAKADKQAYDPYDLYDHTFDTSAQNLDEKNIPERETNCRKKFLRLLMGCQKGGHIGHIGQIAQMQRTRLLRQDR
jgi:hypothetical protein